MAKLRYVSQFGEIWHKKTWLNQGAKMRQKKKKKKTPDLHLHFFVDRMRKFAPLKILKIK
jgi:hypothetical protein